MSTVLPFGMLVFGPLADFISIEFLLVLASGLMAIPGLWMFFNRQPVHIQTGRMTAEYELQTGD